MGARVQTDMLNWEKGIPKDRAGGSKRGVQDPVDCLQCSEPGARNAALAVAAEVKARAESRARPVVLHEQRLAWLGQSEQLRNEIRRGQECLDQVRKELATIRARLEDWPSFEKHCGHNPLLDYMHKIEAQERLERFLPGWLNRREQQLRAITRNLDRCAKQNGVEHHLP
jgi:hypothetical protein